MPRQPRPLDHDREPAQQVAADAAPLETASRAAALRLSVAEIERQYGQRPDAPASEAVARAGLAGSSVELPHRAEMEERLGLPLEGVRAHVGAEATAAADSLGAEAYTYGRDVAFRDASPDRETVAHELTHVVQQAGRGAGSIGRDEAEAEAAARGAGATPVDARPAMRGIDVAPEAMTVEPASPEVRMREATETAAPAAPAEAPAGPLLDDAQIASAIAFNEKRWNDPHRGEILGFLRGSDKVEGGHFEARDVLEVARLQKAYGGTGKAVDGKIGQSTAATMLGFGLVLSTAENVKASQVKLVFYPGEFEDIEAWKQAKASAAAAHGDEANYNEYRETSKNAPPGHGTIYVQVGGNIVDRIDARGGPPVKLADGSHTADPSKAGSYTLGEGKSHVTSSWKYSQIAWGAPIREQDGEIQFKNPGADWAWATGDKCRLKHPFHKSEFMQGGSLMTEWQMNDFGETAFRVQGSPGLFVHTTPMSEEAHQLGQDYELRHSHGCLHVFPADRERLMAAGYMQKGVTLVIKKYDEALDMTASNRSG